MSPVYDPPREKMSRITLANLAFLGVNAVVAVALVYGLWRGGRLIVSSSADSKGAQSVGSRSGDARAGGDATPGDPSATPRTGHEPGAAVYYSSSTDYNAAHPLGNPNGSAAGNPSRSGSATAPSAGPGSTGDRISKNSPGSATYAAANPNAPGSSRPGAPGSLLADSSNPAAAGANASSRGAANPASPRPGDGFTTTGRTTSGTTAPPPIRTPTTPPASTPPPSTTPPDPHHDPTPADDPPPPTDPGSDRTPPVLDSIVFDPPQVTDGGSSVLYVHAHDDLSGVRSVTGTIKSPTGGALFSFAANDDGSGTTFAARVNVPPKAEEGNWYVANIYIADRVDNTQVLGYTPANVPGSARLHVTSSQSDTTAPSLLAIDLENGSVRGGETERIRLSVSDDASGVASIVGAFQSPARAAGMTFTAHPEGDSGAWIADLAIPTNADCGEWRMTSLRMTDHAGNAAALGADAPQISRVSFGVMTDGCDSSAPYLDSLSIAPSSVSNEAASEVTITAVARDDGSGVASASGWVGGPVSAGGETPKLSFTCGKSAPNDPDSPWTCRIPVPQYAARGTWHMGRMRLTDRAGNVHDYMPDESIMQGATFDVQ